MPNMSHCRFENTVADLKECQDALCQEGILGIQNDSSEHERPKVMELIELCREITETFG